MVRVKEIRRKIGLVTCLYTHLFRCHSGCMSLQEELREFLKKHGRMLNTDLGQHFLIDEMILEKILEAAAIDKNDHIVEIGAGVGILTRELTQRAAKVTSIEIDSSLLPLLKLFTKNPKNLTVIEANALQVPMPDGTYSIVANIPYHITSPLLRHVFLESESHPKFLTLLIQREVAEKICDEKDAGLLTILVRLFGTPTFITRVAEDAFLPPPKVESAVIKIETYKEPIATKEEIEKVWSLAKLGFSQKRKMLRNTLGSLPDGDKLLQDAGIEATRRPQTLSVTEWLTLARLRT